MEETPISLCEELYEASIKLLEMFGDDPPLCETQVRKFMRSQQFRDFFYAEILRISLQQNYVPCEENEVAALHNYARIWAEVMLRGISKADYIERSYDIKLRQN